MFFFFFSSRRRHTRFDCDWSSDVCSSDLPASHRYRIYGTGGRRDTAAGHATGPVVLARLVAGREVSDRKSVVEGKRVDLGGRRIIKKKKINKSYYTVHTHQNQCYTGLSVM